MNGKVLNKEALKTWILSKVVTLTNNLLATTPGVSAMDAAQGPVIQGQIDAINSNLGGLSFGLTEDGTPGWKDGADTVFPFYSAYKNIMYVARSTQNVGSTSLIVPENITRGTVVLMTFSYTGSPSGTFILPVGIEYDVVFEKTIVRPEGDAKTNAFQLEVLNCKNIAGKTFSITNVTGYHGAYIFLLH